MIRQAMLEAFGIEQPLEETILDKNVMKAIQMVGGPGSGKGYIVRKISEVVHPAPKVINSDTLFEAKLQARGLPMKLGAADTPERDAQTKEREVAKQATIKVLNHLLNGFLPLILDATGKNYEKTLKQKQALEELGYDVMCIIVNTSLPIAQERNAKRARSLQPQEVEAIWTACQANFPKYQSEFPMHFVANNDTKESLDEAGLKKSVQTFFASPLKNPIGQSLVAKKKEGSINRQIPPEQMKAFD